MRAQARSTSSLPLGLARHRRRRPSPPARARCPAGNLTRTYLTSALRPRARSTSLLRWEDIVPRDRRPPAALRQQHARCSSSVVLGHPGRRQLPGLPPPLKEGPHQEPALQPVRPDEEGRRQGLKDDVQHRVLPARGRACGSAGDDRMKDYQALSPRVKVGVRGPASPSPARARELRRQGARGRSLVVERGDKRERVSNDSEQDLTNAFIKVTRDGKKTVCFAEGEGERDIDDARRPRATPASRRPSAEEPVRDEEGRRCCASSTVPADCTVLVVAGPAERPAAAEPRTRSRDYVKGGRQGPAPGRARAEGRRRPTYDALLKEWNIEPGDGRGGGRLRHGPDLRHRRADAASPSTTRTTRSRKDFRRR